MAVKGKEQNLNEVIVEVNGLTIRKDSLYKIEPKVDYDAPDGFINAGTKKLPSEGVLNYTGCPFSKDRDLYDTGFYEESSCYNNLEPTAVKSVVASVKKHIVTPYERIKGTKILAAQNFEFWDNYTVTLEEGRIFNTSKIEELLELYIAMRGYSLTPQDKLGDPKFRNADFVVKDASQSISFTKQKVMDEFKATATFSAMLYGKDRPLLVSLMKSLSVITINIEPDDSELSLAFKTWLDKDAQNIGIFNRKVESVGTEKGKTEVMLRVAVLKAVRNGVIRKAENGEYTYEGTPIGIDTTSIVNNLMNDSDLSPIMDTLLLNK